MSFHNMFFGELRQILITLHGAYMNMENMLRVLISSASPSASTVLMCIRGRAG